MIISPSIAVYAFIPGHGVSANSASRLNLRLVNETNGYFHLEDQTEPGSPLAKYKLTINNNNNASTALGFSSSEQNMINKRFQDIVLAMNLILDEAILSTEGKIFPKAEFSTDGTIKEEVGFVLRRETPIELDENSIISNLKLIDKVDRHSQNHKGDRIKNNLSKALNEYEKSCKETQSVDIFKRIYNALEFAIISDQARPDKRIDSELNSLANVPPNQASIWREATYYRQKHPDHTPKQLMEFSSIASQMPNQLKPLRQAANTVIIKRLIPVT